jgi:protein O-GlcNAc transferase
LQCYQRVDIALDTFPYHGTATTCEALWMGVPVITLVGPAHVTRVGVSLLTSVGLTELIAADDSDYVRLAVELAADSTRRERISANLRERMQASPLMDAPGFAREVEAAYRQMWRRYAVS